MADERNFTRATARSFVTQPGLSSSIRALEREPRAQLFDRGRGGAALTRAGRAFLPRARRMLAEARAAHRELIHSNGLDVAIVARSNDGRFATLSCISTLRRRHAAAGGCMDCRSSSSKPRA